MKILIPFGTTEGQTRKIARYIARSIEKAGHTATLFDCTDGDSQPDVEACDVVILAASVHHKRYQTAVYHFVASHLAVLQSKPVAFVSVSLAGTLAGGEKEAQSYVDDFIAETGLHPDAVHLAEGAVRYFQYSRTEAETIDLIVFKGQKKMPDRGSNPEYTDWTALETFAHAFLDDAAKKIAAGSRPRSLPA